jgi:hypothetical protein
MRLSALVEPVAQMEEGHNLFMAFVIFSGLVPSKPSLCFCCAPHFTQITRRVALPITK